MPSLWPPWRGFSTVRVIPHAMQERIQSLLSEMISTVMGTPMQERIQREKSKDPYMAQFTYNVIMMKHGKICM